MHADIGIIAIKLNPTGNLSRVMPFVGIPLLGSDGSEQLRGFTGK